MKSLARWIGGMALTVPLLSKAFPASDPTPIERDYLELSRTSDAHSMKPDQVAAIAAVYGERVQPLQQPARLRQLPARDLAAVFNAASTMAFYDPTATRVNDLLMDLAQREKQKAATAVQYETAYDALYQSRRFTDMAGFARTHPNRGLSSPVAASKPFDVAQRHGILTVDDDHTLRPRTVDVDHGGTVVVISNPGCHFTQYAITAIENDPELKAMTTKHSACVAPADRNPGLAPFVAWNTAHLEAPIALADSKAAWPEVPVWQTPLFLYFKDGKIVDQVVGWPKEGNAAAVKAAWAKASAKG